MLLPITIPATLTGQIALTPAHHSCPDQDLRFGGTEQQMEVVDSTWGLPSLLLQQIFTSVCRNVKSWT